MSAISKALQVYFLIPKEPGLITIREICIEAEVGHRSVKKYVDDLRLAGLDIESRKGCHGGYYIPSWGKQIEVKTREGKVE